MSTPVPLQTVYSNARNGAATFELIDGSIATQSALLTRTAHYIGGRRGRLFEPSRTNSIRNSTFTGGTAGVLGSGGVLPTNMAIANFPPASTTVSFGTDLGLSYIDITLNGTPTGNVQIFPENNSAISASDGQSWTHSARLKQQAGSQTNIDSVRVGDLRYSSSGFHSASVETISLTTTATKFQHVDTSVNDSDGSGTIQSIRPYYQLTWSSGAINITIRLYSGQMEQGAFPTAYIPTSGTAVTRLADRASVALSDIGFDAGGGSIFVDGRAYYNASGSGSPVIFQVDDGTANNRITLDVDESAGEMRLAVVSGSVSQASETMAYTSGAAFKAGFTYDEHR